MAPVKIVIVDGGSFAWGPLFIRDLLLTPQLAGNTVVLHDIDPEALELLYALGQKLVRARDFPFALESTPPTWRRFCRGLMVHDLETAEPMLDEILYANRQYLPQFYETDE